MNLELIFNLRSNLKYFMEYISWIRHIKIQKWGECYECDMKFAMLNVRFSYKFQFLKWNLQSLL